MNNHLLKIQTTIEEYARIAIAQRRLFGSPYEQEYRRILPQYLVAKCPYCNSNYLEQVDLYSIYGWSSVTGKYIFREELASPCTHLYLATHFVDLHGTNPGDSIRRFTPSAFHSEVPHVIPPYLQSDIECKAVLHALPICRIQNGAFTPFYTVFMLCYFAPEEEHSRLQAVFDAYVKEKKYGDNFWRRDLWPLKSKEPENWPIWWDLEYWVKQGKLLWIDAQSPALELRDGLDGFPYANLPGRRYPYRVTLPVPVYDHRRVISDLPKIVDDMEIAEKHGVPVEYVQQMRLQLNSTEL